MAQAYKPSTVDVRQGGQKFKDLFNYVQSQPGLYEMLCPKRGGGGEEEIVHTQKEKADLKTKSKIRG